ncbi:MAG: MBL fold metallo-hydrolase [Alphaproteobacteria bacterium]|jgi:glyoxylase-like metal-dependent hydrolase (beta-lactamase superfamily II)|nr:MBL fold metallo-hydrolase [Alphaproteobacteria bacterium]MDP6515423.1 MBL fold metallo-hydrolase [Alphaproteobacteria bacterium]
MKTWTPICVIAGLAWLVTAPMTAATAQDGPVRDIVHIAGDLYRVQNKAHFNVFLVTPEGIIATDPINADAAAWLKGELDARFGLPVKYLIYSHDHGDHISGGEVFADTATVIAHDKAAAHILGEGRKTAPVDLTFSDTMTVTLGGKTVELVYLGLGHSDNLIVMRFPEERAVFAVDMVVVNGVPYRDFPTGYLEHWIAALERLEAMDFDILVPGHGKVGRRADVAVHRGYIEDLRGQVLGHMRAGKTLDELKPLIDLSRYKDWRMFDAWSGLNIDGMYRHLSLYRGAN